jgi:hypothetical protein
MLDLINHFELSLSGVEKGLNVIGRIPIIWTFSGAARFAIGKLQIITGLAIGCLCMIASEITQDPKRRKNLEEIASRAFEHIGHGVANMARGFAEAFLFGSWALYALYDNRGMRMAYYGESEETPASDLKVNLSFKKA